MRMEKRAWKVCFVWNRCNIYQCVCFSPLLRTDSAMCCTDAPCVTFVVFGKIFVFVCASVCVFAKRGGRETHAEWKRFLSGFWEMSPRKWWLLSISLDMPLHFLWQCKCRCSFSSSGVWKCTGVCERRWHCCLSWCWHLHCPWARPVRGAVTATRPTRSTVPFAPCSQCLPACLHTHDA